MKKLIIKRDGIPPISFTGKLIGTSSGYTQTYRRAVITIHRTKGGKFIAVISCKTCQHGERYGTEAASFATSSGIPGKIGRASRINWRKRSFFSRVSSSRVCSGWWRATKSTHTAWSDRP